MSFLLAASLWTEKLWFDSIGFTGVFTTQLVTSVVLFVIGAPSWSAACCGSTWAWPSGPGPEHRRRGASAPCSTATATCSSRTPARSPGAARLVFGFMAGLSAATQTLPVLAWLNRQPAGVTEPTFGLDTTFFMLEYPVWRLAASLLMSALVFAFIASRGRTSPSATSRRAADGAARRAAATVHLSTLGAAVLVVYGLQNLLDRYALVLEQGTLFTGLHYTDANARMDAKLVIAVIAFIVAALFVVNIFWRRTIVPGAGVVLMLVSSLILSMIYPMIIQTLQVRPNEPDRENAYIAAHLEATKQAYGIGDAEIRSTRPSRRCRPGQLKEDAAALPGIRLMDPQVIGPTFEQLQQVRGYYSFPEILDIDRYTIDGQETDVVVAARELNLDGHPRPQLEQPPHRVHPRPRLRVGLRQPPPGQR